MSSVPVDPVLLNCVITMLRMTGAHGWGHLRRADIAVRIEALFSETVGVDPDTPFLDEAGARSLAKTIREGRITPAAALTDLQSLREDAEPDPAVDHGRQE